MSNISNFPVTPEEEYANNTSIPYSGSSMVIDRLRNTEARLRKELEAAKKEIINKTIEANTKHKENVRLLHDLNRLHQMRNNSSHKHQADGAKPSNSVSLAKLVIGTLKTYDSFILKKLEQSAASDKKIDAEFLMDLQKKLDNFRINFTDNIKTTVLGSKDELIKTVTEKLSTIPDPTKTSKEPPKDDDKQVYCRLEKLENSIAKLKDNINSDLNFIKNQLNKTQTIGNVDDAGGDENDDRESEKEDPSGNSEDDDRDREDDYSMGSRFKRCNNSSRSSPRSKKRKYSEDEDYLLDEEEVETSSDDDDYESDSSSIVSDPGYEKAMKTIGKFIGNFFANQSQQNVHKTRRQRGRPFAGRGVSKRKIMLGRRTKRAPGNLGRSVIIDEDAEISTIRPSRCNDDASPPRPINKKNKPTICVLGDRARAEFKCITGKRSYVEEKTKEIKSKFPETIVFASVADSKQEWANLCTFFAYYEIPLSKISRTFKCKRIEEYPNIMEKLREYLMSECSIDPLIEDEMLENCGIVAEKQ